MRSRKILLLLGILTAGAAIEGAWHVRDHIAFGPTGWRVLSGSFHGPSHVFETSTRHTLEPNQSLRIENSFGDVRVFAGQPGEIRVLHRKRVYDPDKQRGAEFAERVKLTWNDRADALELQTNREQLDQEGQNTGWASHLEVAVPRDTAVEIVNEHGGVDVADVARLSASTSYAPLGVTRISGAAELRVRHGPVQATGIHGPLRVSARHGAVQLEDVSGAIDAEVQHGGVRATRVDTLKLQMRDGELTAESVAGDLEVRGSRAGVMARGVGGETTIRTSHRGVELREAQGSAHVKLQHGALIVQTLRGSLTADVSHGDIDIEAVTGNVSLKVTKGAMNGRELGAAVQVEGTVREVTLAAFHGPLVLKAHEANVELAPALPFTQDISVETQRGNIRLAIPEGVPFDVIAEAAAGRIELDVADEYDALQTSKHKVAGRVGADGPHIRLHSGRGDVYVVMDGHRREE